MDELQTFYSYSTPYASKILCAFRFRQRLLLLVLAGRWWLGELAQLRLLDLFDWCSQGMQWYRLDVCSCSWFGNWWNGFWSWAIYCRRLIIHSMFKTRSAKILALVILIFCNTDKLGVGFGSSLRFCHGGIFLYDGKDVCDGIGM